MTITQVVLAARVEKGLAKLPPQVHAKLVNWTQLVTRMGLDEVRKIPGYHDEPINVGPHKGQRSIRLNKGWRAFYVIKLDRWAEFVSVEEVNKHQYDR